MRALCVESFLTEAVRRSGQWVLWLEFFPTSDEEADWSWLSWSLPWLAELGDDRGTICSDLRRHGVALVVCDGEAEALSCSERIRGFRVGRRVFACTGAVKTSGSRAHRQPVRKRRRG